MPRVVLHAALTVLVVVYAAVTPYHNWDMIPYVACAAEWRGEDPHAAAYAGLSKLEART